MGSNNNNKINPNNKSTRTTKKPNLVTQSNGERGLKKNYPLPLPNRENPPLTGPGIFPSLLAAAALAYHCRSGLKSPLVVSSLSLGYFIFVSLFDNEYYRMVIWELSGEKLFDCLFICLFDCLFFYFLYCVLLRGFVLFDCLFFYFLLLYPASWICAVSCVMNDFGFFFLIKILI